MESNNLLMNYIQCRLKRGELNYIERSLGCCWTVELTEFQMNCPLGIGFFSLRSIS